VSLQIKPTTMHAANAYVAEYHRHHPPVRGCKFALRCVDAERTCGVAIVGRPVSRVLDDGETCEITRCCTDGTRNACSMLYGACVKAAFAMGYRRVITYTLDEEPGTSLLAAGFVMDGRTTGGSWDTPARRRSTDAPTGAKKRWIKERRQKP